MCYKIILASVNAHSCNIRHILIHNIINAIDHAIQLVQHVQVLKFASLAVVIDNHHLIVYVRLDILKTLSHLIAEVII